MISKVKTIKKRVGMDGWVTWCVSLSVALIGLYKLYEGQMTDGITLISLSGFGIGLGRKATKTKEEISNMKDEITTRLDESCR